MTKVQVQYVANRESLTFSLSPAERAKFPQGRSRVVLAFEQTPSLTLLTPADTEAIGSLLTTIPTDQVEVEFVEPGS